MIEVVRETYDEGMPLRDGRNFHQGHSATRDQVAEKCNMELNSRGGSVRGGLAFHEDGPHFMEQIVPNADVSARTEWRPIGKWLTGFSVFGDTILVR
jgi:hypothetical protein